MELNADLVILDDEEVRLNAQVLEIQYTSTAGILLWAGRLRRLDFPEALDELLATGYRLQPKEYKRLMSEWQAWKKSK
ncbi:MAG: hypothetical protein KIT45_13660 [Fimbriimonadia bacterium]|nr:hypothetical protein [Fimbriimonadia bacterium]